MSGTEQILSQLVERLPMGMFAISLEGAFLEVNQALVEMLGYSSQGWVLRKGLGDVFADAAVYAEVMEKAAAEGEVSGYRVQVRRKGEGLLWAILNLVRWGEGYAGTLNALADLDGERAAAEALIQSEQRYRSLFEGATNPIFLLDQGLTVLMVNKSGAVNFRLPVEKAVGKPLKELAPNFYEILSRRIESVQESGKTIEFEDRILFPVGAKWWWFVLRPISLEPDGEKIVQLIAYDLTGWKMAEQALMESEERYRAIVESQTEFIVRWRPDSGMRTFVNEGYARYLGMTPEELLGFSFYDMVTDEVAAHLREKLATLTPEKPYVTEQHLAVLPDGRERWMLWTDRAIFDDEGEIVEVQSVGRDTHERKEMEDQLLRSEERYRAIVEDQTEYIVRWKLDGSCTFANASFCRHFGLELEEILGKDRFLYESEEDIAYIRDIVTELTPGYPTMTYEIRVDLPVGFSRWYQWTDRAIFDENEQVIEIQSVGADITNRKRAEEQLNLQNSALKAAENGIVIMDLTGKKVWVNPAFTRLTGYTSREAVGKSMDMFISEEHAPGVYDEIFAAMSEGKSWQGEVVSKRKDGSIYYEQKTINPVRNSSGIITNFVEVKQDVTERRHARERLQKYTNWLEIIRKVDQAAMDFQTVDEIAEVAIESIADILPYDRASVTWFDLDAGEFVVGASSGDVGEKFPVGMRQSIESSWFLLEEFRRGEMVVVLDIEEREARSDMEQRLLEAGFRTYVLAPIFISKELRGTLNLLRKTPNGYHQEDLETLKALTVAFSTAMENAWLFEQVMAGRQRLQQLNKRLVSVQETERRALAQELHDEVGQILTGLKLTLASGVRAKDGPTRDQYVQSAAEMIDDLISEVQELSLSLRPYMLDDHGIIPALLWLIDRYQKQTSIAVDFKHGGIEGERLDTDIETAVYRIVQESLTNAARHAGVDQVRVRVIFSKGVLSVSVEDQGKGIPQGLVENTVNSVGLTGMQERAAILGGLFRIESKPDEGTRILVDFPISGKIDRRNRPR